MAGWFEVWKLHGTALLAGCVLDWILGDPYHFPHPVRLMGRMISWLEGSLRKRLEARELAAGFFLGRHVRGVVPDSLVRTACIAADVLSIPLDHPLFRGDHPLLPDACGQKPVHGEHEGMPQPGVRGRGEGQEPGVHDCGKGYGGA